MKNYLLYLSLFISYFLTSISVKAQNNPDFYIASNNVTCMCPDADFGDTGTLTINGVDKTFTKRTRAQLGAIIANDQQDPEIALTCTSGITDMSFIFQDKTQFNQDINHWDVSNVTTLEAAFDNAELFNEPLNDWDTGNVTSLRITFRSTDNFNQPLNNWDVSNVTDLVATFSSALIFNQNINNWDVSNVTTMRGTFGGNQNNFNQPLNNWDVSNVVNFNLTFFNNPVFNQPLNDWNISSATTMRWTFYMAHDFNQPLDNWNVSNVTDMGLMFLEATSFDQNLGAWNYNQDILLNNFVSKSGLSVENYDSLLDSFVNQNLQGKNLGAQDLKYCNTNARNILTNDFGWSIIDDGLSDNCITCEEPSDLTLLQVFDTAAQISFESPQSSSVDVVVLFQGDVLGINIPFQEYRVHGISTGLNSFFLLDLEPDTSYDVYFRLSCGISESSEFAGPLSVQTMCATIDLPVGQNQQTFCTEPLSTDLLVVGQNLQFYEDSNLTSVISSNARLTNEQMIYVTQTLNNCESEALAIEIIVEDTEAPVTDIQNLPGIAAQCEVTSLNPPTATDNCDGGIVATTNVVFPITETTTIPWTFEDASGNSATQNQVVTINDTSPPVANVSDLSPILGECQIDTLNAPTATDNCDGEIVGTTDVVFPITETTTIQWTFEDASGNSATQTQVITIDDTTAPIADVQSLPSLEAPCEVASLTPPTATDNCDGEIVGTTDVVFPITETTTIQWTFEDASGNSATQNQVVTINDTSPPVANVSDLSPILGECQIDTLNAPTATDNCDGEIVGTTDVVFPITETITIQWTFEDASGNSATQNQVATINNTSPPVANVSDLSPILGECQIDTLNAPTATDNCNGIIQAYTNAILPITENIIVVWIYEDEFGNTSQQNQFVVIFDLSTPEPNVNSLSNVQAQCEVASLTPPTATDNCDGDIMGTTNVVFPITETTTIQWTFEDASGNSATQTQVITIDDTTAPIADVQSLSSIEAQCEVTSIMQPTATDNCNGVIDGITDVVFPITETITVQWTFEDSSGNISTQNQVVVIEDTIAPIVDVQNLSTIEAQCEVASLTPPTATDNCDGDIIGTTDVVFPITETTTIQWAFEDTSGNSATQTQVITIDDTTAPIADVQSLLSLEAQCEVAYLTPPTATDNCHGNIMGTTNVVFPITETTTIQWTFEDASGNSATQNQVVTINDTSPPVANVSDLSPILGECQIDTLNAPTATDNCEGDIMGTTNVVFPITETTTIQWTFEDASGNSATQTQVITIDDTTAPIADVQSLSSIEAQCEVTSIMQPTATDNCNGVIDGITDVVFPITDNMTVQWTFADASGNSSTQNQVVVIEDTTAPIVDVQNLSTTEAQCEVASLTPPTATDNCDDRIVGTTAVVFPITETTTIQWTFEDASGNSATQTQIITIDDTTPPLADLGQLEDVTAVCQVDTITAPTASDNCFDNEIIGFADTTFPITESTTIIWTFEDASGNNSTLTQNILIDNSQLSVTLNNNSITLDMDEAGFADIQSHVLDYDTNANCGGLSFTYDNEIFNCEDFASTEVNQVLITFTINDITIDQFTVDIILIDPERNCDQLNLNNFQEQNISIYPNPANHSINIYNTANTPINSYTIYDVKGRKLKSLANKTNISKINVSNYAEGIYILELRVGSSTVLHKFIIKR